MKKILVAYDGTEPAEHALATAIDLAKAFDAAVGVVSVVPIHAGRAPIDPWDDRPIHAAQLGQAQQILAKAGIEAQLHEPMGDPARAIERTAAESGYDTIVIGSRGLGRLERVLQGSVSEHVATHATETVIIRR
ncbi:MAG TPA: universal stress protein [Candidatus Limnocylindria bacterium]